MYRTPQHRGFGGRSRRGGFPGFPPGFGEEWGRGRGMGGRRGPRRGRGDVKAAILAVLADGPMHGYEIINEISERSGGLWRPSPGSVYPTLQLLTDQGLLTTEEGSGSKVPYALTEEGRAEAEKQETPPWEGIAGQIDPQDAELGNALRQLVSAATQVFHAGSGTQKARAIDTLNETRRSIYAILGSTE